MDPDVLSLVLGTLGGRCTWQVSGVRMWVGFCVLVGLPGGRGGVTKGVRLHDLLQPTARRDTTLCPTTVSPSTRNESLSLGLGLGLGGIGAHGFYDAF